MADIKALKAAFAKAGDLYLAIEAARVASEALDAKNAAIIGDIRTRTAEEFTKASEESENQCIALAEAQRVATEELKQAVSDRLKKIAGDGDAAVAALTAQSATTYALLTKAQQAAEDFRQQAETALGIDLSGVFATKE